MRYAELDRLMEYLEWIDGKFIYLHRGNMLKVKVKQREGAIRLSDMGKILLHNLIQIHYLLPELPAMDMKLSSLWIRILKVNPVYNNTFRKIWDPWPVFYYPDKALQIATN